MIPDKIYLWETLIINGGYDPAWHKNSFNDSDVEYIRKDALLEWLKEKVEWYEGTDLEIAYLRVIDKINKM